MHLTVGVRVCRNEKRLAVKIPLAENFSGTNAQARTLRQQLLEELEACLDEAFRLYRQAVDFVSTKFNAISPADLAQAKVSPGQRLERDTITFYVPLSTKLYRKGRGDLESALLEIRRRIYDRVQEFLNTFVNSVA